MHNKTKKKLIFAALFVGIIFGMVKCQEEADDNIIDKLLSDESGHVETFDEFMKKRETK